MTQTLQSNPQDIGRRIRERRVDLKISQHGLAIRAGLVDAKSGTKGSQVSRWEAGRVPRLALGPVARALGVSTDWLLTGVSEK